MSSDLPGNAKNFRLVRKCIYKLFLYGIRTNDSLIMKVIDQIMGFCIKIMTTFYSANAKMHPKLIFFMVVTLIVHPRIMKIHKTLPGDIPKIFPYQHLMLSLRNCIHKNFLYGGHPRSMKIHKNLSGVIPNIFLHQNIILSLRNCIHK